jgi:exodeoxyribonuclease-5
VTENDNKTEPIKLSEDQERAIAAVEDWKKSGRKRLTFGGYAGTGKTTIIKEICRKHRAKVCAFTGKAAHVLTTKGVPASTIHSLIYTPFQFCKNCEKEADQCKCKRPKVVTEFRLQPYLDTKLVIVDEASMVNRDLLRDLESFDVQVLYVGDHGQLEPIGDDPGLMHDPEVKLETIHRQAAGSPIIQFAHHVRRGYAPKSFGEAAELREGLPDGVEDFDAILCGYNKTRCAVNARVRERRGFKGDVPEPGERVICLRNNKEHAVFNGMQATVTKIDADAKVPTMHVVDDLGTPFPDLPIDPEQFGQEKRLDSPFYLTLWDFGYCMTAHKSQGSEWDNVLVLEQIARSWSPERWRYTVATRAAKRLTYSLSRGRR